MKLLLPEVIFGFLKSGPIGNRICELIEYSIPLLLSGGQIMIRIFIKPVLILVNSSHPGKRFDKVFEVLTFCTLKFGFVCEEYIPMIHRYKLHRHGSKFCYLRWGGFKIIKFQIT